MKSLLLAWRLLGRDWRAGEMRVFLFAVVTAVMCLSSIGLFTDRMNRSINTQSAVILGGDLVIVSDQPINPQWHKRAAQLQLHETLSLSFLSMVQVNDRFQLATVKAVDAHYPLLGTVSIADAMFAKGRTTKQGPPPESLWVSPRLASSLQLQQNDKIKVGEAAFKLSAFLQNEPDSPSDWVVFAPRLMMRLDDVDKTKIIQPGSRLTYRWGLIGTAKNLEQLRGFIEAEHVSGVKILSATHDQPTLDNVLTRALDYFHLASLMTMVLAAIACAIAIKRYTERHYRTVALLRTFGMVQAQIVRVYLWNILGLGLVAAICGSALGLGVQWLIDFIFSELIALTLPSISVTPILTAMLLALIVLTGVGMPHLLRLKNVPTIMVLRNMPLPSPLSTRPQMAIISRWQMSSAFALAGMYKRRSAVAA